jgi:hypothetical protein
VHSTFTKLLNSIQLYHLPLKPAKLGLFYFLKIIFIDLFNRSIRFQLIKLKIVFNKNNEVVIHHFMGINHPISLRHKKNYGWDAILYKFKPKAIQNLMGLHKNLIEVIDHYFQYILISKPKVFYGNEKLYIILGFYVIINNKNFKSRSKNNKELNKKLIDSKDKKKISSTYELSMAQRSWANKKQNSLGHNNFPISLWKNNQLKKFENLLEKRFGIKIEIQLIKFKSPITDSKILAQFISINLKNYSISAIWRIILKKIKFKNTIGNQSPKEVYIKKTPQIISKSTKDILFNHPYGWYHLQFLVNNNFSSYINGLKLKISGRALKRRGASRTKIKDLSIGSFKFNSINSLIDYGHIERKDKNGSQSIKVYSSTTLIH